MFDARGVLTSYSCMMVLIMHELGESGKASSAGPYAQFPPATTSPSPPPLYLASCAVPSSAGHRSRSGGGPSLPVCLAPRSHPPKGISELSRQLNLDRENEGPLSSRSLIGSAARRQAAQGVAGVAEELGLPRLTLQDERAQQRGGAAVPQLAAGRGAARGEGGNHGRYLRDL